MPLILRDHIPARNGFFGEAVGASALVTAVLQIGTAALLICGPANWDFV